MNELTELLETKMQSFLKDAALQVQNGICKLFYINGLHFKR